MTDTVVIEQQQLVGMPLRIIEERNWNTLKLTIRPWAHSFLHKKRGISPYREPLSNCIIFFRNGLVSIKEEINGLIILFYSIFTMNPISLFSLNFRRKWLRVVKICILTNCSFSNGNFLRWQPSEHLSNKQSGKRLQAWDSMCHL